MNRNWLEVAAWCALSWLLSTVIPGSYRVGVSYEIKGSFDSLETIPDWVDQRARELAATEALEPPPSDVRLCGPEKNAARVSCVLDVGRRSRAFRWNALLSEKLPSRIGWIEPSVLLTRIREKSAEAEKYREESAGVGEELAGVVRETEELARDVDDQQRKKEQIESDLKNRERQLEILNDAIAASRETSRTELFEQKRSEVTKKIDALKVKIEGLARRITQMAEPLAPRDRLTQRRDRLAERTLRLEKQIDSFKALYASRSTESRIADPEHFQMAVSVGDSAGVRPVRSAEGWFYACLAGFLLFLLVHRNDPSGLRPRTYWSSRQVEKETGMAFLGGGPPPRRR
jgi:phage host-nuclease inhibitor protein Gam